MKILMVNKFYYNRGGSETYTFGLAKLLETQGHKVIPFSMHHKENFPSAYSNYFVSNIDYLTSLKNFGIISGFKVAARTIYSLEAKIKIENLIKNTQPDIAHLHNIHHHLTPSILYSLKKYNIPIIWTLHDYRLVCPNSTFIKNGEICEKCKGGHYYQAVLTRCKKGSLMASLMATIESYVHRYLRIYRLVDKFITPSRFLKDKLVEYGFDERRIAHLPHFIQANGASLSKEHDSYFAYIGRLSEEKGVDTLIGATLKIKEGCLVVAGEGPMRKKLEEMAINSNGARIEFAGYLQRNKVDSLIKGSLFVVVPSKCYENFPYSILEAFALGKPVIATRIGGMPEQVEKGINGLLFEPGNEEDLRKKVRYFLANRHRLSEMGRKAREKVERKYRPDLHYQKLMEIYQEVLPGFSN